VNDQESVDVVSLELHGTLPPSTQASSRRRNDSE
jgi:hypothetical protein